MKGAMCLERSSLGETGCVLAVVGRGPQRMLELMLGVNLFPQRLEGGKKLLTNGKLMKRLANTQGFCICRAEASRNSLVMFWRCQSPVLTGDREGVSTILNLRVTCRGVRKC